MKPPTPEEVEAMPGMTIRMRPWSVDNYGLWTRHTNRANAHVWRYEGGRNPMRWRWSATAHIGISEGRCKSKKAAMRRATIELAKMTGAKP